MKYILTQIILIGACFQYTYAADTLKIEKPKVLSVKTNIASLVFRGCNLQVEYIANKHLGVWAEVGRHCEEQSMLNSAIREMDVVMGVNYYSAFKNSDNKMHSGPYIGPYVKYKQGSYGENKCIDYSAFISGLQGGIQSVFKQNLIFNMGMGFGMGYFTKKKELQYSTFYDKYNLPLLDFRANMSFGYMF